METFEKYLAIRNLVQKTENRALVYGVTISEYLTLKEIHGAGTEGISRSELAAKIGQTPLELTKALMPLEKLCFVETLAATENPRERKVAMTSGGVGIYPDIEHEFHRRMNLLTFEIGQLAKNLA